MDAEYVQLKLKLIPKRPVEVQAFRPRRAYPIIELVEPVVVCACCAERKRLSLFPRDERNTGRYGRHSYCHDCRADMARHRRRVA